MTKTHYTTEWHRYLESAPCENPKTCTEAKHWKEGNEEYDSLEDAQESARGDDAPAVRIIKVRTVVERSQVEVISA